MKKRILTFLLAASMILLTRCHSSNNSTPTGGNPDSSKEELTKLTLNEVAHSIFYAPMYVAIEKDYFRKEGIELECKFCSNGTPILKLAVHSFWFSGTRFLLKTVRFSFIIVM